MGWLKNRRETRKEIKLARIEAKTDRVAARQETKQTAYEMGIDPNASMWQGLSGIAGSVADVVKSTSPAGAMLPYNATKGLKKDTTTTTPDTTTTTEPAKNKNMMYIIVAAVVVLYVMMKKK